LVLLIQYQIYYNILLNKNSNKYEYPLFWKAESERQIVLKTDPIKPLSQFTSKDHRSLPILFRSMRREIGEYAVRQEEVKFVQGHLNNCVRREGLQNMWSNCRQLAVKYLHLVDYNNGHMQSSSQHLASLRNEGEMAHSANQDNDEDEVEGESHVKSFQQDELADDADMSVPQSINLEELDQDLDKR